MQRANTERQIVTPLGVAAPSFFPQTQTMLNPQLTPEQEKEHVKLQRAAAERTLREQGRIEEADQLAHTNSEATVASHKGLAPHDTPKPREMEAAKTDLKSVTGDPDVTRVPLKTNGKTTDLVTKFPKGARPKAGPANHLQKAAAAAAAGDAAKPAKKARKRAPKKKVEKAAE